MKFSQISSWGVLSLVVAQSYGDFHHHQARHDSQILGRDRASPVVEATVVTVYELNGQTIPTYQVEACLKESKCVLLGNKPTSIESTSVSVPSVVSNPTSNVVTNEKSNPLSVSSQIPSSSPAQIANTNPNVPAVSTPVKNAQDSTNDFIDELQVNTLATVNSNFPSGEISCSNFPSKYGAIPADWVGLGGWTGVQKAPGYSGSSKIISYIETAKAGDGCTPSSFCSYSCPAGYQKSQWPAIQGVGGQSVGGLFCNKNGKLELSRASSKKLCTAGVGNIQIKNLHNKNVAICRTDYPGTESQTVALNALPGKTVKVTCPDAKEYYRTFNGAPTSAQYYINPSGYRVQEACTWGSPESNIGNWAPVNMGVGRAESGTTFVSLFQNAPTNPNGVLDFNIEITGDVNGRCGYKNGKFYKDGVISSTGCTVAVNGMAVFVFT